MSKFVEGLKQQVQAYHGRHSDLHVAHHYDFAIEHGSNVKLFAFGLNPGETKEDKKLLSGNGHFNPYDPASATKFSRSAKNYVSFLRDIMGGRDFLISEFFFWSSANLDEFKSMYGCQLQESKHLGFCFDMNNQLFTHYKPDAVIVVGLLIVQKTLELLKLRSIPHTHIRTLPTKGSRILEHYEVSGRSWFFVKHPRWLKPAERIEMKGYLAHQLLAG